MNETAPINFDEVMQAIVKLAGLHRIERRDMQVVTQRIDGIEWNWDYADNDRQAHFDRNVWDLNEGIRLHQLAADKGDWLASQCGLLRASIASHDLYLFFSCIFSDIDIVLKDSDHFVWSKVEEVDLVADVGRPCPAADSKIQIDIDLIRNSIIRMANRHGVTQAEMSQLTLRIGRTAWNWDYRTADLQCLFHQDFFVLVRTIEIFYKAFSLNNWPAILSAITMARITAFSLYGHFIDMHKDLRILLHNSDAFAWPEIPDTYQIPEKYGHRGSW